MADHCLGKLPSNGWSASEELDIQALEKMYLVVNDTKGAVFTNTVIDISPLVKT